MKYDSLKEYIEEEHLKDLRNRVKRFLEHESGVYIKDIKKFKIISIYCKSKPTDKIKIAINMMIKVSDKPRRYLTLYTDINFKEITIENTKTEKTKDDLLQEKILYDEFAIPKMTDQYMEEWAEDFWQKFDDDVIFESDIFPYQYILPKLGMKIEEGKLPDNIMGRIYFKEGELELLYKNPMLKNLGEMTKKCMIERGAIVLNDNAYFMENVGNGVTTITHEIIHWIFHRDFWKISNLLQETYTMNCDSEPKKYTENLSNIEKARWIVEWQANTMGMKLAMPRNIFKKKLLDNFDKILSHTVSKHSCRAEAMEEAVIRTAVMFGVSELAAKERAIELGITEATGTCVYIKNTYHLPFFFKRNALKKGQTFLISEESLGKLCSQNKYFRELLESNEFIYLGYVVCRNNEKYIEETGENSVTGYNVDLTDYARDHVEECCLIFNWKPDFEPIDGDDFYERCYLNKNVSEKDYYGTYSYNKNEEKKQSVEEMQEEYVNIRKRINKENEIMESLKKESFSGVLKILMEKVAEITIEELAENTQLSTTTIKNYRGGKKKKIPTSHLLALCVGMHLKEWYSKILLNKGGLFLLEECKKDWCYLDLIKYHADETLKDWYEKIEAWNKGLEEGEEKIENVNYDPEKE